MSGGLMLSQPAGNRRAPWATSGLEKLSGLRDPTRHPDEQSSTSSPHHSHHHGIVSIVLTVIELEHSDSLTARPYRSKRRSCQSVPPKALPISAFAYG